MAEDARIGPAGEVLAGNVKRVREAQRLTYAELARKLAKVGRPIPELGLRRIERAERRVDFEDLLALCYVLQICPVDLMVSKDATDEPYPVTPGRKFTSDSIREWIRGAEIRLEPVTDPGSIFADPGTVLWDASRWMPTVRRKEVMRRWLEEDEEDL
jgi:transcriptional regulator with XRE-family HTH domain